jgi:CheY-like chemotaxis protein
VLAVDDNPDMIVLIRDALKETPYTVVGVQDPTHIIEMVQQMRPSAITLDVLMTDVNGWQILDQLKRNPATASIPVVMLSVISEPTVGFVLGADDYLVKPFNKQTLLNTLQRVMVSQRVPSQVALREKQPVSKRAR